MLNAHPICSHNGTQRVLGNLLHMDVSTHRLRRVAIRTYALHGVRSYYAIVKIIFLILSMPVQGCYTSYNHHFEVTDSSIETAMDSYLDLADISLDMTVDIDIYEDDPDSPIDTIDVIDGMADGMFGICDCTNCEISQSEDSCRLICPVNECVSYCEYIDCFDICIGSHCEQNCFAVDDCNQSCLGGSCSQTCNACDCFSSCTGGFCDQLCNAEGQCSQQCSGGGCIQDCDSSICTLTCLAGDCVQSCTGNACGIDCIEGGCTINCQASICSINAGRGRDTSITCGPDSDCTIECSWGYCSVQCLGSCTAECTFATCDITCSDGSPGEYCDWGDYVCNRPCPD